MRKEQDFGRMILPDGKYYSLDDRKTRRNNNVVVVGTTGAAKTRTVVTPNLLECTGSYVVTDPKGNLYRKWGRYMRNNGYRVLRVSFIHPEKSAHYNPLMYLHSTQDVMKMAHTLSYGEVTDTKDPFWDLASQTLLCSVIGYLWESALMSDRTLENVTDLVRMAYIREDMDDESTLDRMMDDLEDAIPNSWAVKQYKNFRMGADKTLKSILITTAVKLSAFDTEELKEMLSYDEIDFSSIGQRKTAVFVEVSDTDRSMDILINLFFTQAMNELCSYADEHCHDSELPVPVRFIMDDFATNCRIDNFDKMISNIRSRKISAMLVLQSLSQLSAGYGKSASTIIDDCDTMIYMGGNDPDTAAEIARRVNRTESTILHMPLSTSWIIRRGEEPYMCHNLELDDYLCERGIEVSGKSLDRAG